MTQDYKQRSYFSGVRMICAQISAILAGYLPKWIIDTIGGKDSPDTFLYMGIIFAGLFMVVLLVTYVFSWEREADPAAPAARKGSFLAGLVNLFRNIGSTLRIRAFRLHLGMYLGGYICQDIYNAAFTYFVAFVLGGSVMIAAELMGTMYFAQLVAVVAFIPLILWLQPAPSFRLASFLYAAAIVGLAALYHFRPANTMLLLYVPVLIAGLGRGGLNFIPWNIYNYIADVDEVVTGERREGVFSGVMIFTRKTAMAVAVMLVGLIFDAGGLVKGATTQSVFTQHVITIVLVAGPLALLVFGVLVSLRFKLNKYTHAVLMAAIARFKGGDRTPANDQDKAIVEDLTGYSYDALWGNNTVLGKKK